MELPVMYLLQYQPPTSQPLVDSAISRRFIAQQEHRAVGHVSARPKALQHQLLRDVVLELLQSLALLSRMKQRCRRAYCPRTYCVAADEILAVIECDALAQLLDCALGRGVRGETRLRNVPADAAHVDNAATTLLHMRNGSFDAECVSHNVGSEDARPVLT